MKARQVREMRSELGRVLHEYYINNGDDKFEVFINRVSKEISDDYGDSFSPDNLRIMEAEYVTFNAIFNDKDKSSPSKDSIKK